MTCPYPEHRKTDSACRTDCPAWEDCPGDVDEPETDSESQERPVSRLRRVYVAGPLSGSEVEYIHNCARLDRASAEVVSLGMAPFNPAADRTWGQFVSDPLEADVYKALSFAWLYVSDVMYVCGRISPGVQAEVEFCGRHDIPVVYSLEELAELRGTEP